MHEGLRAEGQPIPEPRSEVEIVEAGAARLAAATDHIEAGSPTGVIKAAAIGRVVRDWSLRPSEVAYIGDTPADIDAARSAGVISLGAAWAPAARLSPGVHEGATPNFLFLSVSEFASWVEMAGHAD